MVGKNTVKKYQSKKEYLVLSMVKKYPLYSLNRLSEELPEVSRHSIQRILEKNNLSTLEKRLTFAEEKENGIFFLLEKMKTRLSFLRPGELSLAELKKRIKKFQQEPQLRRPLVRNLAILTGLVFIFWFGVNFVLAKQPEVSLEQPPTGFVNEGEKLFVIGKVLPKNSLVKVNGKEVSLNGDGSFTAVIEIPTGESVLEVEAKNRRKEAKVLRLVKRVATEEELQAQEETEAEKKLEAADKAAELDRTVQDLMAAKNAVLNPESGQKGLLRVLNNRIKEESGFASVIGEVVNLGEEAVSWVMVTARFLNKTEGVVDTKYGFATDFGEVLESGGKAEFETQATMKEFDHYSLELSWEKGEVAGLATEAEEATAPGEMEEKD